MRLEFNQTHLDYHYAVEAVLLGGQQPTSILETSIMSLGLLNSIKVLQPEDDSGDKVCQIEPNKLDFFTHLPVSDSKKYLLEK